MELLQGNNREKSEHCQATSKSYYFCCDRIRRSAILNKLTIGELQKHIVLRGSLHVVYFLALFHEEKVFRNPGKCSISYFVLKSRYVNYSWLPRENINYCCCCRNRRLGICRWVLAGASTFLESIRRIMLLRIMLLRKVEIWAFLQPAFHSLQLFVV